MNYKRAYQIVLKKVEDLERENERLEAERTEYVIYLRNLYHLCRDEDGWTPSALMCYRETERWIEAAIHPQSE